MAVQPYHASREAALAAVMNEAAIAMPLGDVEALIPVLYDNMEAVFLTTGGEIWKVDPLTLHKVVMGALKAKMQ